MVCIGGMEGVERELEMFRELRKGYPIYLFERTGGAAAILAEREESGARVIDREVLNRLETLRRNRAKEERNAKPERTVVPYPLIAQILVQDLSEKQDRNRR